jgi:hypothetical protein
MSALHPVIRWLAIAADFVAAALWWWASSLRPAVSGYVNAEIQTKAAKRNRLAALATGASAALTAFAS